MYIRSSVRRLAGRLHGWYGFREAGKQFARNIFGRKKGIREHHADFRPGPILPVVVDVRRRNPGRPATTCAG